MKNPHNFRRNGFTLIELMLSISIMLLIAAGAAVSFRNSSTTRYMTQNYYNVLNDIRTAQIKALTTVNNPGVTDSTKLTFAGVKFLNNASSIGEYTVFRSNGNTQAECRSLSGVIDKTYTLLGSYEFVFDTGVTDFCVFFDMTSGAVNFTKNGSSYTCDSSPQYDSNCRVIFGTLDSSGDLQCRSLGLNNLGLISDGGTSCL